MPHVEQHHAPLAGNPVLFPHLWCLELLQLAHLLPLLLLYNRMRFTAIFTAFSQAVISDKGA
jgi:hypothetical protein